MLYIHFIQMYRENLYTLHEEHEAQRVLVPFFFFTFLLNLLGWHWLIKLHGFQVYNSITHHLYIVLCVYHPKSSLLPSPFIPPLPFPTTSHAPSPLVITALLWVFVPNPFTFSPSPQPLFPSLINIFKNHHNWKQFRKYRKFFCLLIVFVFWKQKVSQLKSWVLPLWDNHY